MNTSTQPYPPIENHGIIGDLHTVALVAMDGSIDFMCFPRFDSPTVFASLLDAGEGGHFKLAPVFEDAKQKQLYLPDTNVLLSRFLSEEGVGEVTDFMPIEDEHTHQVVRQVKTVRGKVRYRMVCKPRFDYGRTSHTVDVRDGEVLFISEDTALRLRTPVPLEITDGAAVAEFTLSANESIAFVLEEAREGQESTSQAEDFVPVALRDTVAFWRNWMARSSYQGRWRDIVNRSALALKLMVYVPQGSLVASPTFGLPEDIGGVRNWDYRYTWIRDASFTLYALSRLGYGEESSAFMKWIERRCVELEEGELLQVMYGIDGRQDLTESTLPHFAGYKDSTPVRIGNGAYDQLQLDIYGALMDSVYLHNKYNEPITYDLWLHLVRLLDWVCENWQRPDNGIWEIRGGKKEFLYSRLMCWVALDRALRLARQRSFPAPVERWRSIRDTIYYDIFENFWDPELKAFVQYKGSKTLDAACLLMPMLRFVSPTDPRWLSTLAAVERTLVSDSLVYRYRIGKAASDGLAGEEGTFTMCSFWYTECLSRAGQVEKARFYFEKMLGYANHLGLYSEELGPRGEHLGNFPQAFTHLGLISAAYDLNQRLEGVSVTGRQF